MQYLKIEIHDPLDVSISEITYLIHYFNLQIKLYKEFLDTEWTNKKYPNTLQKFITEITLLRSLTFHLTNHVQRKEYKVDTILEFSRLNRL